MGMVMKAMIPLTMFSKTEECGKVGRSPVSMRINSYVLLEVSYLKFANKGLKLNFNIYNNIENKRGNKLLTRASSFSLFRINHCCQSIWGSMGHNVCIKCNELHN